MTQMLERAARAAMTVCVGVNEDGDDVYVGLNTAEEMVRAVLMAVGEPDEATVTKACDHGYYSAPDLEINFGAMIDAILAGDA